MKKLAIFILITACALGMAYCQQLKAVKVKVTEEDGAPIEGADVGIYFSGYHPHQTKEVLGKTDGEGVFSASGKPLLRMMVRVKKEGYYLTKSGRLSRKQDHDVTYVLRKKKNPISLYAKKFRGKIPSLGKRHGFDFEEGDWVAPHGSGKSNDVYFKVELIKDEEGKNAGKLEVTCQHESEGFYVINDKNGYHFNSELVMPHEAASDGYVAKIKRVESGYQNEGKEKNTSYFLRTRSVKLDGKEYQFNYAKLKDGIDFMMSGGVFLEGSSRIRHPNEVGVVNFSYYFNPTLNDRNLEFDTSRNLLKNLDSTERVFAP